MWPPQNLVLLFCTYIFKDGGAGEALVGARALITDN